VIILFPSSPSFVVVFFFLLIFFVFFFYFSFCFVFVLFFWFVRFPGGTSGSVYGWRLLSLLRLGRQWGACIWCFRIFFFRFFWVAHSPLPPLPRARPANLETRLIRLPPPLFGPTFPSQPFITRRNPRRRAGLPPPIGVGTPSAFFPPPPPISHSP